MCDSEPSFLPIPSPADVAGTIAGVAWDAKGVFGALAIAGVGVMAVSWLMANLLIIALVTGGLVAVVGGGTLTAVLAMKRLIQPKGVRQYLRQPAPAAPVAMQRAIRGQRAAITTGQLALPAPDPLHGIVLTRGERTRTPAREG